jgi:hypothetical protein
MALALVLALGWVRLQFAEAAADRAKAGLELCAANLGTLEAALEAQNEAVRAFQEKADEAARKDAERAERARQDAERRRAREAADTRAGPERMNDFMREVF